MFLKTLQPSFPCTGDWGSNLEIKCHKQNMPEILRDSYTKEKSRFKSEYM
jgi:hypothetical protein